MKTVLLSLMALTFGTSVWACTDFSGEWKGTCKHGTGQPVENHFKLAQRGCEVVTPDSDLNYGIPYILGKETKFTIPTSEKEFDLIQLPEWDAQQETFTVTTRIVERLLYPPSVSSSSISKLLFRLSGDSLLVNGDSSDSCEFHRVSP